jgi:uncharacterized membrane protein
MARQCPLVVSAPGRRPCFAGLSVGQWLLAALCCHTIDLSVSVGMGAAGGYWESNALAAAVGRATGSAIALGGFKVMLTAPALLFLVRRRPSRGAAAGAFVAAAAGGWAVANWIAYFMILWRFDASEIAAASAGDPRFLRLGLW